jgi:hypothetical protein
MLGMNVFRIYTHWLPVLFFAVLLVMSVGIFHSGFIASGNPAGLSDKQRSLLATIMLIAGFLFAGVRIPYLLEGHLHHLVGPVVYDDTWHFQEINSLVNSLRYPAHFSLVPHSYFSLYYAPWMLIAALYLAFPVAGFTIKAAFAVGCAVYQILICLTLLHIAIVRARSPRQLYWAIYLVDCWAGLESFFSLLYYLRHNAWWLVAWEMPIHFPTFGGGIVWAVHHLSAATALILCWFLWDGAKARNWSVIALCSILISFAFYGSVFVFLGAVPLGIVAVCLTIRDRWREVVAVACVSAVMIWPMLWLYLGKTSDVRFLLPFIGSIQALFPATGFSNASVQHGGNRFMNGMWSGFVLFLAFLCLNFLPYAIAVACYGKQLSQSARIFVVLISLFLISTYFIGFQEGDNYASRGYVVPILVLAWICAGLLPSIRNHKWIAVLLLLGAFGSIHEGVQVYKRAVYISRVSFGGKYDSEILAINRDRGIRVVRPNAWGPKADRIYDVEKFVAGGKATLVTADRQLECPGPRGPWRWQQVPDDPAR